MSCSCNMEASKFRMNTENFVGALKKLIVSDFSDDVSRYRTHQTASEMLAVCDKGDLGGIQWLLERFFLDNGYALGYDGKANVVSITHVKDHWHEDTDFFKVFAEFVEKGSYIEMSGEQGDRWRMYFDGEHCKEINAVITFPGIEDEAKDARIVYPRLLEAVEAHEDGRVFDNADDMFEYMFNEGYTFAEFVNKLTPETKEAIVFGQKWNGGVIKDNGKYYYSPEFDRNFNADVKNASFDRYKVAKDVEFENFKNALECLDYSLDDYTEEELKEMFDTHYDALGNDDVYNAIYNETLEEVVRGFENSKNKKALDWSIEVYSIKDSNDLLVLEFQEDPGEDDVVGGYAGYRLSYDLIEEQLDELTEDAIDNAIVDDFYFEPNDTTGKVYLSDVVKETGIEVDGYICGFDSSYFMDAVSKGFAYVQAKEELKETAEGLSVNELIDKATQACEEVNKNESKVQEDFTIEN